MRNWYVITRWMRLCWWLEDWVPAYRDSYGKWRLMLPWDYVAVVWGRLTEKRYGWPKKPEKQFLNVVYDKRRFTKIGVDLHVEDLHDA